MVEATPRHIGRPVFASSGGFQSAAYKKIFFGKVLTGPKNVVIEKGVVIKDISDDVHVQHANLPLPKKKVIEKGKVIACYGCSCY